MFPNRRTARQAASEMVGNLGSDVVAIRAREYRGGPFWMKDSDKVIGRRTADKQLGWRDDFLGHDYGSAGEMGPHVNVWGPGLDKRIHLFY